MLPTGFHVSRGTQEPERSLSLFAYRTITFFGQPFQYYSAKRKICNFLVRLCADLSGPTTSRHTTDIAFRHMAGFELFPFRSPLLREYLRFLFLGILRCFTSPGMASRRYVFTSGYPAVAGWIPPFRHLRVKNCLRLAAAYRSLPRLSSPFRGKASTMRPF